MAEERTLFERLSNRFFAIPAVAQFWARLSAGRTQGLLDAAGGIPFAPLRKPLGRCRAALLTTAGVHRRDQPPFDMQNPDGDASFREIPNRTPLAELMITHKYYDHTDADRDLNVVFPLAHFQDLAGRGVIGGLATYHFGFMGHIDGPQLPILVEQTARTVAANLRRDGVDFAFLTPA
jgi:D-proline reductase (dithiol) PrdB